MVEIIFPAASGRTVATSPNSDPNGSWVWRNKIFLEPSSSMKTTPWKLLGNVGCGSPLSRPWKHRNLQKTAKQSNGGTGIPTQQIHRHLLVGKASDQSSRVDQRVESAHGDAIQKPRDRPIRIEDFEGNHRRIRQGVHNAALNKLLITWSIKLSS